MENLEESRDSFADKIDELRDLLIHMTEIVTWFQGDIWDDEVEAHAVGGNARSWGQLRFFFLGMVRLSDGRLGG